MTESDTIDPNSLPLTIDSLMRDFAGCGLSEGQTVLVHTRMSALGWVAGGAEAIIRALLGVLGPGGTLMMPAFSASNTDPRYWQNPPVPEHWWPIIREHMPAYDPLTTPTRGIGQVTELFRHWQGVLRSPHPDTSFAARGPNAAYLTDHELDLSQLMGEDTPVGRLYELDGYVFLLGPDHGNNSSLHLAEYRANFPKEMIQEGCAIMVNGVRQWVSYETLDLDESDFAELGADYDRIGAVRTGRVGKAHVRFMKQRPLVDFAVQWMEQHRNS